MSEKSSIVKLTGLWINESKAGKKFMSGNLGNAKVLIFKCEYPNGKPETAPDYELCLAPKESKKETPQEQEEDSMPF